MDPAQPFAAAAEELEVIEFLEGIAVEILQGDVLDEGDDRHRCGQRLGEGGNQKRGRRPILRGDDADLVGDARIGVRHDGAGILGPVADLADAELRRRQMDQRGNRLTKDGVDAMAAERAGKGLRGRLIAAGRRLFSEIRQWRL